MNRHLAFIATGLCAAPLLALAGFAITSMLLGLHGGGSDQTIAQGYAGLLGGIALGVLGFFVLWYISQRFVTAQHVRYLVAADVAVLLVGIAAWRPMLAIDPKLEYADGRAVLQVELRIPQTILARDRIDTVASIDFAGGQDLSEPHPERARQDGDAVILPWETTPFRVRAWEIRVIVRDQSALFELPLRPVPADSPDWSNWIQPSGREGYSRPAGVTLRYRFLVRPHGT
jgi:hypothetical protein